MPHKTLTITYTDHSNFVDVDGFTVTTRTYNASINGVKTGMQVACPTTADDAAMRQALRDHMTGKGFIWDSEV